MAHSIHSVERQPPIVSVISPADIISAIHKICLGGRSTKEHSHFEYLISNSCELWALLEMVQLFAIADIPSDPVRYIEFLMSLVAIRNLVELWRDEGATNSLGIDPSFRHLNPVRLIRHTLGWIRKQSRTLPVVASVATIQRVQALDPKSLWAHETCQQSCESPEVIIIWNSLA